MAPLIRRIALIECLLAGLVCLVALADVVPLIGTILNPHSEVGAVGLLLLFVLAIAATVVLTASVPLAAVRLLRRSLVRSIAHVGVVVLGALSLLMLGVWIGRVVGHQL